MIFVVGDYRSDTAFNAIESVIGKATKFKHCPKTGNDRIAFLYSLCNRTYIGKKMHVSVILTALKLLMTREEQYPKTIVCDMKCSMMGDAEFFLQFGIPRVVAITRISYETQKSEVQTLLSKMGKNEALIVSADDEGSFQLRKFTKAFVISIGLHEKAILRASDIHVKTTMNPDDEFSSIVGMMCKLQYAGNKIPLSIEGAFGTSHVMAALIAAAVGIMYKIPLLTIVESLHGYVIPAGNLHLLAGIKHSMIIDDSEDASFDSVALAIEQFSEVNIDLPREKFVVIGDIPGLGAESESLHAKIGAMIVDSKTSYLLCIGERARDVLRGARKAGMPEDRAYFFAFVDEAAKFLQNRLEKGDLVLVVGGANMRMERIVKEIMAEPLKATGLLVRQENP